VGLSSSEEKSMNKNKMELLGGTLAGMMFLSGCASATETNNNQTTESAPTPGNTAESPYVKYTPTTVETAAATLLPTPTRPDMAGGVYSSEQQSLIENGAFKNTEQALTAWFKYWANATNNPFQTETTDIHFKYVFDSTGKSAGICMESMAYSNKCFTMPIINGKVAEVPPTVSGEYTIPVGYGPLEMSDQLTADQVSTLKLDESLSGSVLGYENGGWVRYKNGEVVAVLDLASAQWKENSLIEGNIFQDPQTEADLATVVESPSPIDKPSDFAKWQDEYLNQIYEKLTTWSGTPVGVENIGIDFNGQRFDFMKENLQPIASYKFKWQGQEILTKTFILKDTKGNLVPFSVTYTTPDSPVFNFKDISYKTPSSEIGMTIRYGWNNYMKVSFTDPFIDAFLPEDTTNNWRKVLNSDSTLEERELFSRTPFVIDSFGN
jgi:hypothetical protein